MPDSAKHSSFSHLIRAGIAVVLVLSLPFVLYFGTAEGSALQAYQDALAAVIAFYFGASTPQGDED